MKTLYFVLLILGTSDIAQAAFCGASTYMGVLVPTTVNQTTSVTNSGTRPYWTVDAVAGATYTFSTCGLTSIDTELEILNGVGGASLFYNNNSCGNQSRLIWTCNATGQYSIFITRIRYTGIFGGCFSGCPCSTLNSDVQLNYSVDFALDNRSCLGATQICSDATISGNNSGFAGQEMHSGQNGCLATLEHQSSWFYFNPATSGTLGLNIQTAIDYDFAIWDGTCANLGAPLRCSYSAQFGNTGLGNGATDLSEGTGGNRWVAPLNIVAGQTYILLIDNFTADNTAFNLVWDLYNGATLDCTPIPLSVDLVSFEGFAANRFNHLVWKTKGEVNNSHFILEKSKDLTSWSTVSNVPGAGTTFDEMEYSYDDYELIEDSILYYRIIQVDWDGKTRTYDPIAITNSSNALKNVARIHNILGQEIDPYSSGLQFVVYENGVVQRRIK